MSLVEELGGYECAKAEYDDPMYEDGELYTIKATGARFFKHNLADELLEYRRQHNIYEVGDWVVSTLHGSGDNVFQFENWLFCFEDCIRHANDAEIEANRRLDLPESVKSLGEVS